jgi:flagellar assembly protein FliH
MPVIKADQSPPSLASFSMADIEKQAKAIIIAARLRAERLIIAAQQEAEDLKRTAHAQALIEGKKAGLAQGIAEGQAHGREEALNEQRQQLATLCATLAQAAQELEVSRLALESDAKQAVVSLAIAIAQRVTKRMGVLDPKVAEANIGEALRLVVHTADVRIAIHPTQKDVLAQVLPRIKQEWPEMKHVELIADGTLSPGGCRIFSGGGQIDGDLDLQLNRIAQELIPQPEQPNS